MFFSLCFYIVLTSFFKITPSKITHYTILIFILLFPDNLAKPQQKHCRNYDHVYIYYTYQLHHRLYTEYAIQLNNLGCKRCAAKQRYVRTRTDIKLQPSIYIDYIKTTSENKILYQVTAKWLQYSLCYIYVANYNELDQ